MPVLELNNQPEINIAALEASSRNKQRPRMLLAMALLLAALILVLARYREFWLTPPPTVGTSQDQENQTTSETAPKGRSRPAPANVRHSRPQPAAEAAPSGSDLQAVITERSVLPPLQVEIVSAAGRQILHTRIAGVSVEIPAGPSSAAAPVDPVAAPESGAPSAASQVRFSRETTRMVEHPVEPSYPALARQQNVQGSVVLLARIGTDGNIQDLQVLSGPQVLSDAAREAVKQWHFKPYYQSGQAIETEARITVNFTVSTR